MATSDASGPRLLKLEEAQAFSERTIEQLSAEMAELNRRLGEVSVRLSRLEQRLEGLSNPSPGEDDEAEEGPGSIH
jgi:uncharacterized coiled-coil protein SlyX